MTGRYPLYLVGDTQTNLLSPHSNSHACDRRYLWSLAPRASSSIVVLVIVLVLFGAKRLPELARSLGQSVNAFKKGIKEVDETPKDGSKDDGAPKA